MHRHEDVVISREIRQPVVPTLYSGNAGAIPCSRKQNDRLRRAEAQRVAQRRSCLRVDRAVKSAIKFRVAHRDATAYARRFSVGDIGLARKTIGIEHIVALRAGEAFKVERAVTDRHFADAREWKFVCRMACHNDAARKHR